jgi:hypothetical protein
MLKKWGPGLIAAYFTALLISYPNEIKEGVKEAISTCTDNIIPSLFLFSLLSSFIVNSGAFLPLRPVFKRFMRLFMLSQNCAPALILGSFSGFPIGAKTAVQLYKNKLISKAEAENLLSFCNNCSPVFLIYVSISLWGNKEFGIYLYLIQLISALVSGLMICRIFKAEQKSGYGYFKESSGILDSLVISVKDALKGVGTVCGFVIFMSVIPVILRILNLSNSRFFGLITGFFEITAGLFSFTALGVLTIPALIFARGFFLAYTTAWFGIIYGYDGLLLSVVLFAVTAFVELPAVFVLYCEFLRSSQGRIFRGGTISKVSFRSGLLLVGVGVLILSFALQLTVTQRLFAALCGRIFI